MQNITNFYDVKLFPFFSFTTPGVEPFFQHRVIPGLLPLFFPQPVKRTIKTNVYRKVTKERISQLEAPTQMKYACLCDILANFIFKEISNIALLYIRQCNSDDLNSMIENSSLK